MNLCLKNTKIPFQTNEMGFSINKPLVNYKIDYSFFSSRGGLGKSAFLDTFSFLVLGLDPKTRKEKVSRKALLPRPPREEKKE